MLLIGSRALAIRAPKILGRKPLDFDFIATEAEANQWISENAELLGESRIYMVNPHKLIVEGSVPVEFELIEPDSSARLLVDAAVADPATIDTGKFGLVPSLNTLFLIKSSHKYLKNSPHFWKTAVDYHMMKAAGAIIEPHMMDVLKLREKETYTYKHPKLNVSKKQFFDGDQVNYVHDHDSIHEAVKHLDKPAYRYFAADGEQVKSDKTKFFNCSREVQLFSVLEESYVLSIERSQVPHPGVMTPEASFRFALSKVCSSIASGWWRAYAYENVFTVLNMYSETYMDKFREGLANGTVKPHVR